MRIFVRMLMTISAASDDCDGGDYSEVVDENACQR